MQTSGTKWRSRIKKIRQNHVERNEKEEKASSTQRKLEKRELLGNKAKNINYKLIANRTCCFFVRMSFSRTFVSHRHRFPLRNKITL